MAGPGLCGHILQSVPTDSNLWPQIAIRSHRFESVATDCNLFPQIQICFHKLEYVATDQFESVATGSN